MRPDECRAYRCKRALSDLRVSPVWYGLLSLRNRDLAESATQNCFPMACKAQADFGGDCGVATLLTRIATNLGRGQFWKAPGSPANEVGAVADRVRSPRSPMRPSCHPKNSAATTNTERYIPWKLSIVKGQAPGSAESGVG